MSVGKKSSNIVVWVLIAMLVVGLGGFGVSNFGGNIQSIGAVGDEEIAVNEYARELQRELRAQEAATGSQMTLAQAQQLGIVTAVRGRVIAFAAMDNEVKRMGVSVGDQAVAEQVIAIESFQGLDGSFDREAYRFTLEQNGLTEEEFETQIREETARSLLQGAIVAGVRAPEGYTDALYNFIAERRSFVFAELTEAALDGPVPTPSDDQLTTYYQDNAPTFTSPETKAITYAWLTPEMILDTVEVDEDTLRKLYDERISEYVTPERRLVERLVFGTQDEAEAAAARLSAGEVTFEALVEERGLALSDVDMGDVSQSDLGPAGAAVFALTEPGLTGATPSDLGPAIFRMNGILAGKTVSYDAARSALRDELARDRARRVITDIITDVDDKLAAGATLEELSAETEMQLGTIAYHAGIDQDIAAYDSFRAAAEVVSARDFPEVIELDDGGIFALHLDDITPPALLPLDAVRDQVTQGWQAAEARRLLAEKADGMRALLAAGDAFETLGLTTERAEALTRGAISPITLAEPLFALAPGAATVIDDGTAIYLLQLTEVLPPETEDEASQFLRATLDQQAAQGFAQDMFGYFAENLVNTAGLTLDQAAINAVHAQFP